MKSLVTLLMVTLATFVNAQDFVLNNGVYEMKVVEHYNNTSGQKLYEQSLMALSDLVGSKEKSKFNIDIQDKEAGTIVFKGGLYLGFRKTSIAGGHDVSADMTIKVRCKDGRVQYTYTVPSITIVITSAVGVTETVPLSELIPEYRYKARLTGVKKTAQQFGPLVEEEIKKLHQAIINKTKENEEDDF